MEIQYHFQIVLSVRTHHKYRGEKCNVQVQRAPDSLVIS